MSRGHRMLVTRLSRWGAVMVSSLVLVAGVPSVGASGSTTDPGLVVASPAPIGDEFAATGPRAMPWGTGKGKVAHNPDDGEYLVVWADRRRGAPNRIYGQRVSAVGERMGTKFRISTPTWAPEEHHGDPVVAWNSVRSEYLVLWSAGAREPDWVTTVGQRVSPGGERLGERFRLTTGGAKALAFSPADDQYLVVGFAAFDEQSPSIAGTLLNGDGTQIGDMFRISGPNAVIPLGTAASTGPGVAFNTTRMEYLVAWIDLRMWVGGLNPYVYGQRLTRDGARIGGNLRVSGFGAIAFEDSSPAVAHSPVADQYLVAWVDLRKEEERGADIFGQVVNGDGGRIGTSSRVSGKNAIGEEFDPTLTYNSTDDVYLATWTDSRKTPRQRPPEEYNADIFAQPVSPDGERLGTNIRVTTRRALLWSGPHGSRSQGVYNPVSHEYLIVWDDQRRELQSDWDVFARRVAP